ncbi:MAG TPA: hypothetical protein VGG33_28270 [Polyangia bacterium]
MSSSMIRKLTTLSVLALSLLATKAAQAEWIMLGAYDFQPYSKTTDYQFSGGRGGYVASGHPYVRAALRLPEKRRFKSFYCQVLDASAAKDISITVDELISSDSSKTFGARTVMSLASSGALGHTKLGTTVVIGNAVSKSWECIAGDTCYYHSYFVTVSLPDLTNTNLKSCALFVEPTP